MDILKKVAVFAAGTLFGTAGIKVLSSRDAKKVYANCTAAVLRAKDCVMDTVTTVQEMPATFMQKHSRLTRTEKQKQKNALKMKALKTKVAKNNEICY